MSSGQRGRCFRDKRRLQRRRAKQRAIVAQAKRLMLRGVDRTVAETGLIFDSHSQAAWHAIYAVTRNALVQFNRRLNQRVLEESN